MSFMSIDKPSKVQHITEEQILEELKSMVSDASYKTEKGYINVDELVSFTKKHSTYLKTHPKVNPQYYLANLRVMTRARSQ